MRDNPWDHRVPYPPVLVPRFLRRPVAERIDSKGRQSQPLSTSDIENAAAEFKRENVDAVVIAFFNSYLKDAHEEETERELARHWPGTWITRSASIAPVMGEYERTSTAVLNAYIMPRTVSYLQNLNRRLRELGLQRPLLLIQSNGGAISVDQVAERPVTLLLSGPAAGVGALDYYSRAIGSNNLISMEIGGTSCDVLLMNEGRIAFTDKLDIGGYDVVTRSVDAQHRRRRRHDREGRRRHADAGPRRRGGAAAGPACYGWRCARPSPMRKWRSDASAQRQRRARCCTSTKRWRSMRNRREIADPLDITVEAAAAGIVRLMEQKLLHAVQRLSVERGTRSAVRWSPPAVPVRCMAPKSAGSLVASASMCRGWPVHSAQPRHACMRTCATTTCGAARRPTPSIWPRRGTVRAPEREGRHTRAQEGFRGANDSQLARLVDLRYVSQQKSGTSRCRRGASWMSRVHPRRLRSGASAPVRSHSARRPSN